MNPICSIELGDSQHHLRNYDDNTFDCCITSPPYKDVDGYSDALIYNVFQNVYCKLKSNSLLFVNFGHLADDKFRPFNVCDIIMKIGFKLNDTIIWEKNHYKPIQGKRRLNNLTEFIFMFYKDSMPELNRLAIGIPYADKSNVGRYSKTDVKCRGNLWKIKYETINASDEKLHNDRFPVELPSLCMKLSNLPKNAYILDPFSGSGTTGVAAAQLGYNYVGIESNPEHAKMSNERIKEVLTSMNSSVIVSA